MIFKGSITLTHELDGAGTQVLVANTNPKWILDVAIQQSLTASISKVMCDGDDVALNYGKDLPSIEMFYYCEGFIIFTKTGNDDAFVNLTYTEVDPFSDPPVASISADTVFVDVASNSALATGIHDMFFVWPLTAFISVAFIGWRFGLWLYRR